MFETSGRLLRLLSLLQSRPDWTGGELAERLEVTTRTVRRDVDRLRALGYPVEAVSGPAGGYRLGIGAALPPLLLDDTEVVAVAVGLRMAAASTVGELDTAADAALAKLDRMLPSRLRPRVDALGSSIVSLPGAGEDVDAAHLTLLAQACRTPEELRFGYTDGRGRRTERTAEPFRLVHTGRRWYLVARDLARDDWRTFRIDRIEEPRVTGRRFRHAEEPDVQALISAGLGIAPYRYQARVLVHGPAADVARLVPPATGAIEPVDDATCVLVTGSDSLNAIVWHLMRLDLPFEALEPPELRDRLAGWAARLSAAARGGGA